MRSRIDPTESSSATATWESNWVPFTSPIFTGAVRTVSPKRLASDSLKTDTFAPVSNQ